MTFFEIQQWLSIATQITLLVGVAVSIGIQMRTQLNVRKVEVATNSIKDALVRETALRAGLEGEARGLAQAAEARARE